MKSGFVNIQIEEMFDQQDYYSEEEDNLQYSKHFPNGSALMPNSGSDFNHLTGEGESLMKMMKERGLDLNDQEVKKLKASNNNREKEVIKPRPKAGFMDGGASASYDQLLKALNKALSSADPQQASAVLSHILEKKTLSPADRNKFGIMKCKILFGLGAYQDCETKAQSFLEKITNNHLVAATFSNYLAKSRAQLEKVLQGYTDFLRAKAYLEKQKSLNSPVTINETDEFADSELDTIAREIEHTEMELNFRMNKYKNATNMVYPFYQQFRHRQVTQIVCGDYHSLFLVGGSLGVEARTQVFGIGENSVGQILGRSSMGILKEPTLIVELSGKNIKGLAASRETSCAWDDQGQIYEWGIKETRDEQISITYQLGEPITHFQKGYQHYAALTVSGKFYTWGNIMFKGTALLKQPKPTCQPGQNIVNISCGNNHIASVDKYGDLFMLGSNQHGQLGIQGQNHAKQFKKLSSVWLGPVRKVVCIADSTFFITKEEQVFYCGKISHNKQNIQKLRQGQFSGQVDFVTSIAGTIGNYYLTTSSGQLYHWDVDSTVKFKRSNQNQKFVQRAVAYSRGSLFCLKSLVVPELTKVKLVTENPCSYEDIEFSVEMFDRFGPYGSSSFVLPPKIQIFLSTYAIKSEELLKQNKLFLDSYQFSADDSRVLLNEIVESRLVKMKIQRKLHQPSYHKMTILSEESGKFFFYVVMEQQIIHAQELKISVSERQEEFSEKNKREKGLKEEERKRKAEIEHQRLLEEKLRKEAEEEQKRKQTQRRAEQAFKKHMREQQELKSRTEEERRARKQLLTGGGFDLQKLKNKNQRMMMVEKQQLVQKSSDSSQKNIDSLNKTNQSFLPDINTRPGSKRKVNLPSKNSFNMTSFDSVKGERPASRKEEFSGTNINLFKSQSTKEKQVKPSVNSSKGVEAMTKTTGGRTIVKRGLSKGRK